MRHLGVLMAEPLSAGRELFPPAKWPSSTQNRPNPLPPLLAGFVSLALCCIQAFPAFRCAVWSCVCFSPFHSYTLVLLATFPHCACQGLALIFPTRWSRLLPVPVSPSWLAGMIVPLTSRVSVTLES